MDSIERMTKLSLVLWFVRSYEIFPMRQMVGQTMQRWSQKGVRRAVTLWSPRTQRKKMPMRKSTRRGEKPPGKKEKCRQELRWQGSKQCLFSNQYLWIWFLLLEFFKLFPRRSCVLTVIGHAVLFAFTIWWNRQHFTMTNDWETYQDLSSFNS